MTAKLTPEACRAGRALLNWSVRDLMREAGVSPNTVTGLERGEGVRAATEAKIVECFERFGVEITNGNGTGARLRWSDPPGAYVDANGLPAIAPIWRVAEELGQPGWWKAWREPAMDEAPALFRSRAEAEHSMEARGFKRHPKLDAVWLEIGSD